MNEIQKAELLNLINFEYDIFKLNLPTLNEAPVTALEKVKNKLLNKDFTKSLTDYNKEDSALNEAIRYQIFESFAMIGENYHNKINNVFLTEYRKSVIKPEIKAAADTAKSRNEKEAIVTRLTAYFKNVYFPTDDSDENELRTYIRKELDGTID